MNRSIVLFIFLALLLGILIWFFSSIFLYITISLILATILRPLTSQILRLQIFGGHPPRILAIFISFTAVLLIFSSFIILFIPLISDQVEIISSLNFDQVIDGALKPLISVENFLLENGLVKNDQGFIVDGIRSSAFNLVSNINFTQVINDLISLTGSFFVGILAVTFITFFLLYEKGILKRQLISIIPNQYFEVFIAALYKIERLLSNYLLGLLFQMTAIFTIASIGLSIMGIKYALTIAVFAAVANLIPYLGPILGATFGIIVGISTSGSFALTNETIFPILKIVGVFGVVQATDNLVLQPLIFSKSVKAHPLEIFVIIFVGAAIAQIPGMIAAIPAYTVLKVSITEAYSGFRSYQVFKK
ncbi:MAG: AI-2E family transporter [Bacteroidota bacterium]